MNGGGMGGYTQIAGGLGETLFGLLGGFGSKPKVAQWQPQSPQTAQSQSLLGNINNFGDISQLGNLYTQYLTQQQNQALPGYSANLASGEGGVTQLLGDANSELKGQIPQDVIDQIQRSDAFGALSGGYAGSQMGKNLTARDLGLTSLDLMSQGASMLGQGGNSAQQWAGMANQDIMNPASQFVSPQQQLAQNNLNEQMSLGTLQEQYNVNAAPSPTMAGLMAISGQFAGAGGGSGGGGQANQSLMSLLQQLQQQNSFNFGSSDWGGTSDAYANALG